LGHGNPKGTQGGIPETPRCVLINELQSCSLISSNHNDIGAIQRAHGEAYAAMSSSHSTRYGHKNRPRQGVILAYFMFSTSMNRVKAEPTEKMN
jgi:hypothetical protein